MDILLRMDRSTKPSRALRTVVSCAAVVLLTAFAPTTATLALDLPKPDLPDTTSPALTLATPVTSLTVGSATAPAPSPLPKTHARHALANLRSGMLSGLASWYGSVLQNHRMADGNRFNMFDLTAAHRDLPFGSQVRVTDLRNHKSVIVTITDRGVLDADRVIDLSFAAAQRLDMVHSGVDPVRLEVLPSQQPLVAEAVTPVEP